MSVPERLIFGAKIFVNDHVSILAESSTFGLYNNKSDIASNAAVAQNKVYVDDTSQFEINQVVKIGDDNASEENTIIETESGYLTVANNLSATYTTASNGYVHANSCFRWAQCPVVGLAGWNTSMLTEDGIGQIVKEIDLRRGGNTESQVNASLSIVNVGLFYKYLNDNSIALNNCECRIYEILNAVPEQIFTGVCEDPKWDVLKYGISIKGWFNKRDVEINTETTDGITYPVTLGNFYYKKNSVVYNSLAKAARTVKTETVFNVGQLSAYNPIPADLSIFRVRYGSGLQYKIQIADDIDDPTATVGPMLVGKYIYVFDDVNNKGDYRKIISFDGYFHGDGYSNNWEMVEVTIDNYFRSDLTSDTFVKIVGIERIYTLDAFKCKESFDSEGLSSGLFNSLYVYDKDKSKFILIPEYSYKLETSNKNYFEIDTKYFKNNPDNILSYIIKPVKNIRVPSTDEIDRYGIARGTGDGQWSGSNGMVELYRGDAYELHGFQDGVYSPWPLLTSAMGNIIDKNGSTYVEWKATGNLYPGGGSGPNTNGIGILVEFRLPEIDDNIDSFDSVCVISKASFINPAIPESSHRLQIYLGRYFGSNSIESQVNITKVESTAWQDSAVDSLLDDYVAGNTNNENFYKDKTLSDSNRTLTRYDKYKFSNITDIETYKSIYTCLFFYYSSYLNSSVNPLGIAGYIQLKLYELAVLFEKEYSISDAIYTPFSGRVFDSTWGGRKTATDLISGPINMLEHICRLQNYSDISKTPAGGWGKAYPDAVKIKTHDEGSFDSSSLTTLSAKNICNQYTDIVKTSELKRSLCRNFNLISYTDNQGRECVRKFSKTFTPSDEITMADIIDRTKISVSGPSPSDIFCEPVVRYQKNFATGEYQKVIKIKNASASAYSSTYVEGITGATAETLWTACHALYLTTNNIEPMPTDLSDMEWINGVDADSLAVEYLTNLITLMSCPVVKLNTHYTKVKSWDLGHEFKTKLPHQTNNEYKNCVLCKKQLTLVSPYVADIEAVLIQ